MDRGDNCRDQQPRSNQARNGNHDNNHNNSYNNNSYRNNQGNYHSHNQNNNNNSGNREWRRNINNDRRDGRNDDNRRQWNDHNDYLRSRSGDRNRDIPSGNPPSNNQGNNQAQVNYIMAEESDSRRHDEQRPRKVDKRVNHRENQEHEPGPSNEDERIYTYDNIEMYGSDPQWDNPIARFVDEFNRQNPRGKNNSGATVSYTHLDVYKRQ